MPVTAHFSVDEFACHDGTPYPIGALDELTGRTWFETRLLPLCETLEVIRAFYGCPVHIDSGYRTPGYNAGLKGAATDSQHKKGRASDIVIIGLTRTPGDIHRDLLELYRQGKLQHLGGLGVYETFNHIDVRPRPADDPTHVAQWHGERKSNRT
jgi:hypothetical protein